VAESKIPYGPTYREMLDPVEMPKNVRERALQAAGGNELDPVNLFNITWKDQAGQVRSLVLPPEITGVDANIVVLLGVGFPSGSHKVGPAYAILMEGCVDGEIIPGRHTIMAPSTGNFGIGLAYVGALTGCRTVVIMPEGASRERHQRIKKYGAELELLSGEQANLFYALQRTRDLKKDPVNRPLSQFELFANYRFHRYVTGNSAIEAVRGTGNGRIACFVSAPGSGGTIAAGDEVKKAFPEARVAAVEPYECPTLAVGGRGLHRVEGIGDEIVTLVHNLINTDFVVLVCDEDCVRGLKVFRDGAAVLEKRGVAAETAGRMRDAFGVSGVCNLLGAIKMAKYLRLGPGDNVVTVATDGIDRYHSVIGELEKRCLEINHSVMDRWLNDIFSRAGEDHIYDFRRPGAKQTLFEQKEKDWLPFGYTREYLEEMKSQEFWDHEYSLVTDYDQKIKTMRG